MEIIKIYSRAETTEKKNERGEGEDKARAKAR